MSELPKGWKHTTLGSICSKPQYGYTTKSGPNGNVRYLRTTDLSSGKVHWNTVPFCVTEPDNVGKYQLEDNDIVISRAGSVGFHHLIKQPPENTVFASYLIRFKPLEGVEPRYLSHFFKSKEYWSQITEHSAGVAVQNVNAKNLASLKLPLAPYEEQKRIADKLDSVLAKVEAAQARLDKIPTILKRFRQSVLAAATSGELTKDWREENECNCWEKVSVGDILSSGPQNGIYKPANLYGSGTKIIRIDGFYDGQLVAWDTIKRVELELAELEKWKLNIDDILINRVNSIEYLGKCGHIKDLPEDAVFESNIMRISLKSDVLPKYLTYFLSSPVGLQRLRQKAKHAVNQASINQTDVKTVAFEKPSIAEQEAIVTLVDELLEHANTVEKQYKAAKARLGKLTQSILAKAFRGELFGVVENDQIEQEIKASEALNA